MIDRIPLGLTNLAATTDTNYWETSLDSTTSPTNLTVTYVGPYPVLPGTTLPAIMLTGTLTGDTSQLKNVALVDTPNDGGTTNQNSHTGSTSIPVIPAPDLALTKTHLGTGEFYRGQIVHYFLHIYSTYASGPINASVPIHVTDVLPIGTSWLSAYGTDWRITHTTNATTTIIKATYIGHYPIGPHTSLPLIRINVKLGRHTGHTLVNTAMVSIPYDSHPTNNKSQDTLLIRIPTLPPTGSNPHKT